MKQPVSFTAEISADKRAVVSASVASVQPSQCVPFKSVVQVHFPTKNRTLGYYNDSFDLHRGDLVYVDGKLAGQRGRVVEVIYHFKIKLSDYRRVVAVADTEVHGTFYLAGSHLVTFARETLPYSKVRSWFKAPEQEETYVTGHDSETLCDLDHLDDLQVSSTIADRGYIYYLEDRVKYICLDGSNGCALVQGSTMYEVEFTCHGREVSDLLCDCFCSYTCKHELAAMLQLRNALVFIEKYYADQYNAAHYFAAIEKGTFYTLAVDSRESGSITA